MSFVKLKFKETSNSNWADSSHIPLLCSNGDVLKMYGKLLDDKEIVILPEPVSYIHDI